MKQYLSLLTTAAVLMTACTRKTTQPNTAAATISTVQATNPGTLIDSFRIADKRFLVYKMDQSPFSPAPELDYDSVEGPQLAQEAARVQRQGDSLVFTLQNGRTTVLANHTGTTDDDNYTVYFYAGFQQDLQQHLNFGGYYESSDFVLVDPVDGKQTHLWGIPYTSPDKKFVLCPSFDLEAGFNNNGFQLYSYQNGSLKLLGETDIQNWGPGQVKWVDNNTLEAEYQTIDTSMNITTKPVRIIMQ